MLKLNLLQNCDKWLISKANFAKNPHVLTYTLRCFCSVFIRPWLISLCFARSLLAKLFLFSCLFFSVQLTWADGDNFADRSDVKEFITMMVNKHGFKEDELSTLFSKITLRPEVIATLEKPYEANPWYIYRTHFVSDKRINDGVDFWYQHRKVLNRAQEQYGVPAEIIVAIIGVESHYGKLRGTYPVLNTLATIGFDYPKRSTYFKSELAEFLILSREQNWDPATILGSYAGAVGQPQFMPSSYRRYGVDYGDKNNHVDLFTNIDDIIGSTANYMHRNGWQRGAAIYTQAIVTGDNYKNLKPSKKPEYNLKQLQSFGIKSTGHYNLWDKAVFLPVDTSETTQEYWLGFYNFYVITRYNSSNLYALAVAQLSTELRKNYQKKYGSLAKGNK